MKTPTTKTRKKDVKFKEHLILSDNITSTPKDKRRIKHRLIARKSLGFDESMTAAKCASTHELTFDIFPDDPKLDLNQTPRDLNTSRLLEIPADPIIELSSESMVSVDQEKCWIKDLHLQVADKDKLMKKGEWLNDTIINAASKLLKKEFLDVEGLQNCFFIPVKCEKTKCWIYQENGQFKPIQAGVQIHFNGKNHWFTSIKLPDEI